MSPTTRGGELQGSIYSSRLILARNSPVQPKATDSRKDGCAELVISRIKGPHYREGSPIEPARYGKVMDGCLRMIAPKDSDSRLQWVFLKTAISLDRSHSRERINLTSISDQQVSWRQASNGKVSSRVRLVTFICE